MNNSLNYLIAIVFALPFLLFSCSENHLSEDLISPQSNNIITSESRSSMNSLDGTSWQLQNFGANGQLVEVLTSDFSGPITLEFAGDLFSGKGGCNHYSGEYDAENFQAASFKVGLTSLAYCGEDISGQEERYLSILDNVTSVELDGNTLTLFQDENTFLVFGSETEAASFEGVTSSTDIEGTNWSLRTIALEEGQIESLPNVATSIRFADNQINGNVGCNSFFGSFSLSGTDIQIEGIGSSLVLCEDAIMNQEDAFLSVLENAAYIVLEENTLYIHQTDRVFIILDRSNDAIEANNDGIEFVPGIDFGDDIFIDPNFGGAETFPLIIFGDIDENGAGNGLENGSISTSENGTDNELEGTSWKLESLVGEGGNMEITEDITVQFTNGQINGNGACNSFFGGYTLSDGDIQIGKLASSLVYCEGEIMNQESALVELLENAEYVELREGKLYVHQSATVYAIFNIIE